MKRLLPLVMVVGFGITRADVPDVAAVRESAGRQEEIRGETQGLVNRLNRIMEEYVRNGLAKGEDFSVLKNVRDAVGALSDEEMEEVVSLLNTAAAAPADGAEPLAKAYAGQEDIILKLKQILAAHEREEDAEALANEVRQLAERQTGNLSATIDTKKLAAEDASANGQAAVAASEEAQEGEQKAIADEVKLVAAKLGGLAAGDLKIMDSAGRLGEVEPQAAAATDALHGGKIDDALAAEAAARSELEDIAQTLTPESKVIDEASQIKERLAGLEQEQRALLDQTTKLNDAMERTKDAETPAAALIAVKNQMNAPNSLLVKRLAAKGITSASPEDTIQNAPEMQAFLMSRAAGLKSQEEKLGNQTVALATTEATVAAKAEMMQEDLKQALPDAAAPTLAATAKMNLADSALGRGNANSAVVSEAEAADELDQAARLLDPTASGRGQAIENGGTEQQIKQLRKGVADLAAQETKALQQGDTEKSVVAGSAAAAQKQAMSARAQSLQKEAAAAGSASAQTLQKAADAFQNASQAMRGVENATAAEAAQEEALKNLAQANQELAEREAALAKRSQEIGEISKEMAALEGMIQAQQQVALDTQRAVGAQNAGMAKALEFARRQVAVRNAAEGLMRVANSNMPDFNQALNTGERAMDEARQKLTGPLKDAEPAQRMALDALFSAQDMLGSRLQSLHVAPDAAVIQAQIGKAQEEAAAANRALAGGDIQHAAIQLGLATRGMLQAMGSAQGLPETGRTSIRAAEQALVAGAEAAAAADITEARDQTFQGQQALAVAQSEAGQAQAGIKEAAPPSETGPGAGQENTRQASDPASAHTHDQTANEQGNASGQGMVAKNSSDKPWTDQAGEAKRGNGVPEREGQFLGLPERDRAAAQESQSEKYPQEYGAIVEEYMRNLSNDAGGK